MKCSLLKIVTWDDVIKNKGGWNTLIWYGGIIGLSSLLFHNIGAARGKEITDQYTQRDDDNESQRTMTAK
jgi:hypothetical protein